MPIQLYRTRAEVGAAGTSAGGLRVDTKRNLVYAVYLDIPNTQAGSVVALDRVCEISASGHNPTLSLPKPWTVAASELLSYTVQY
jgi:hypothetical protein